MTTKEAAAPFEPVYAVPPGETLAEVLVERDLTQTDLAKRLGVSLKHVNQVINGSASISADLALGLESVLGVSADFWLKRESLYRADLARHERRATFASAVDWAKRFPLADLRRCDLIDRDAKGPDLVAELLRFFGVASPEQLAEPSVAFRKSYKFNSDPYALRAWLRWGEVMAGGIECSRFDDAKFRDALQEARGLTRMKPEVWQKRLIDVCSWAGVAVVLAPAFSKVRANGAAWWASPSRAVIQLSNRYKWEDVFWFSFFHEAGHILLHRKKDVFIEPQKRSEFEGADPETKRLEREADRFAATTLIPKKFEPALRGIDPGNSAAVTAAAETLGIAPAIVVGRLQHDTGRFHRGNDLRQQLEFQLVSD